MLKHQSWERSNVRCHLPMRYPCHKHHPVAPFTGPVWHFLTFILIYKATLDPLAFSAYLVFILECARNFPMLLSPSSGMKLSWLSRHTTCFFYRVCCLPGAKFWVSFGSLFQFQGKGRETLHSVSPQYFVYTMSPFNFPKHLNFWNAKSSNSLFSVVPCIPWNHDNTLA